jgi:dolichol-phosphate mannosyltransferase
MEAARSGSGDAQGRAARAADWTFRTLRRIHLASRKPANWLQLFQFALVGASGYVVNLVVFALLAEGAGLHHIPAAIGAFVVAVTNNFLLNRHWTFRAGDGHAGFQAARFLTVSLVGLGLNLALLELLISAVGLAELPAQALAVAVSMPVNFLGNKLWTFDAR